MGKRHRLGQHTLTDQTVLNRIVEIADIRPGQSVLEIGAGNGDLTERLVQNARQVISYEIDSQLYQQAKQRLRHHRNLQLYNKDAFKTKPKFDVLVSNLPYSESTRFIEWLARQSFRRAFVTLQREFVLKLLAEPKTKHYRASSVLAQSRFRITPLLHIPAAAFTPRPKVESILTRIVPKGRGRLDKVIIRLVKQLHSFRGRMLRAALKHLSAQFGRSFTLSSSLATKRVEELTPRQTLQIARRLAKHVARR